LSWSENMVVGLRDFYPKFWMSDLAASATKLGAAGPACSSNFLADSLLGDCPDG
jgi:hypothetical protein